jgi:translation initiation factor 4A
MSGKYPPPNRNNRYNNGNSNGSGPGTGSGTGSNSNNHRYRNDDDNSKVTPFGNNRDVNNRYDVNSRDTNNRYDNTRNNRNISRSNISSGGGGSSSGGGDLGGGLIMNTDNTPVLATTTTPTSAVTDADTTAPTDTDIEYTPKEFDKWEDLEGIISEEVMRGIYAYGFDDPSLIQRKALLTIFDKKDIIAQAQSGTGKTGVFTIGVLQKVNTETNKTQAMILAPTRELAKQIFDVITSIGSMVKNIRFHLLIGGTSTDEDAHQLKTIMPHVIVGCPGRVYDMMRRNHIVSKDINLLVLDEADEMLSVGFKDQIYNIFQYLNSDVQVGLFSATMPNELQSLTDKFMRNPVRILVKSEMLTLEGIKQYYVALNDDSQKYATLKDIFNIISMSQCIIYCNSIKRVMDLTDAMTNDGFPVCCIHSNMEKSKRDESYSDFKAGKHRVLISSNVTSRGIDVQQVRTVLNFDLPKCIFNYLHRIGRSGRWGRKGTAINFVTRWDMKTMKDIERHYQTIVEELPSNIIID